MEAFCLSRMEREKAEKAVRTCDSPKQLIRYQALLLRDQGVTFAQIACVVGRTERQVIRWIRDFEEKGWDSLKIVPQLGRKSVLDEHLVPCFQTWVQNSPSDYGWSQSRWTCRLLANQLEKELGITVSPERLRVWIKEHGFRLYRPTYRFLRANEVRKKEARKELQTLKKSE
jgi:transposase